MATQIQRDPFARATLMREKVVHPKECDWCGSRPGRFRYYWETDSRTTTTKAFGKAFCSASCYRDYHN